MKRFLLSLFIACRCLAEETPVPNTEVPNPPKPINAETEKPNTTRLPWTFGAGIGYVTKSTATFDSMTLVDGANNVTYKGSGSLDYEPAFTVSVEARKLAESSWGFIGQVYYDSDRKVTGGSVKSGNYSAVFTGENPSKLQLIVVSGSAAYRWHDFYLPFGLNYSIPTFTPSKTSTNDSDTIQGGIGAQLGVGFYVSDNAALELSSRATSVSFKSKTGSTVLDWGTGNITNLIFGAKFFF